MTRACAFHKPWFGQDGPLLPVVTCHVIAFLAKHPSPEEILDFHLTPAMQERASDLLEKNRVGELTGVESAELDEYVHINDLVSLLKAQALQQVRTCS